MNTYGFLQIFLYFAVLAALTKPTGVFLKQVYNGQKTLLDFIVKPFERLIYKVARIDPKSEMNWKEYGVAMLIFSLLSTISVYLIMRLQGVLPLNPQNFGGTSPELSFNTAISFVTNTNWQSYSGEVTLGYLTQMTALTVQNFASAAVGMALAMAFIRGISRSETDKLGNFWTDLVRGTLYVLLPLSFILAIFFVSQGVIQNFKPYETIQTLEGTEQTIAHGATASQLAIKMLGTNGGGFFNANSAHPFENPTPFSNFMQMILILLIPAGFTYTLGRMVKSQAHGWAVWTAMIALLMIGTFAIATAESQPNPLYANEINQSICNMEGKETRFGLPIVLYFQQLLQPLRAVR